ncbi:hydroxyphenylacetyl-CoA thioesterase PaaI [Candidatus Uabimicrobium amorphum]|uniref:Thioesterase n=1 Tax=Uabimicrobium amorphum TaxID=2596890 RepID=A0A5S9F2M7_UABAM|nr:hydroxyphenylacetyl-CoA thioesterase PaaI [Candidatus Uabimicrobium amorphum]BBM83766.1 thioesterase [Candidatus Uabimicrobium amorphum]
MTNKNPQDIVKQMMEKDAFSQWLGIEVIEVQLARAVIKMRVRNDMVNGFGICHGGVTFAFADSAFAFASNTYGNIAVSIENSISYPAAVLVDDELTATAVQKSNSKTLAVYDVEVRNHNNQVVALFRGMVYKTKKQH